MDRDSPGYTNEQAAKWFGVGLTSFFKHIKPHLPAIRIGRSVRYELDDMIACRDRMKVGTTAPILSDHERRVAAAAETIREASEAAAARKRARSRNKLQSAHERRLDRLGKAK
jgi:hypothetical protein